MTARDEVLARIAAAHRSAPPPELPYDAIARDYRRSTQPPETQSHSSDASTAASIERLVDRLLDYRASVRQCPPDRLAGEIGAALSARGVQTAVVPDGLDPAWLSTASGRLLVDDPEHPLSVEALDGSDGVLTGCAVAVAETGTLILDAGPGMGRRVLSLIPDYHLCVVLPGQVVADVPEALARLDPTRPLTMISGPSATSDIELDRVEGVHGPRTLEVVIVVPDQPAGR